MVDITALENTNAHRWETMHIRNDRINALHATALRLTAPDAKARYQGVSDHLAQIAARDKATNAAGKTNIVVVPPWFIAIVSEREYGGPPHWDRQLGQGDPLHEKSVHVPSGMGPYLSHPEDTTPGNDAWTRCCVDVLLNSAPFAAKWTIWTIGGVLTLFEEYNGLGYAKRGVPSAYVWSGTDQYVSGKYVRDRVYDPKVVDVQEGCAAILAMMMAVDSSIKIEGVNT